MNGGKIRKIDFDLKIKKRYITQPFNVVVLLFLKPIIDVCYQLRWLDYFISFVAIVIFALECKKSKLKKCNFDILIICSFALYTFTLARNWSSYGFISYAKIVSAYLLYFIGRLCSENLEICIKSATSGYICAMIINFIAIACGKGVKLWGGAQTLTGLYFFKTDMASALAITIILLYTKPKISYKTAILIIIALGMLILTNARISYLTVLLIFVLGYIYHQELLGKRKKMFKINFKFLVMIILIGLAVLFLLRFLGSTELFSSFGFISLDFTSLSDLYSDSNTQGRNKIWEQLLNDFSSRGFFLRLFGINLDTTVSLTTISHNAHDVYLGILYSTGYLGLSLWILQIVLILNNLNKLRNRRLFFITLMITIVYCVFGISVNVNEFSAYSWIFMFFVGLSFNNHLKTDVDNKGLALSQ